MRPGSSAVCATVVSLAAGSILLLGACSNLQMTPHVGGASANTNGDAQVQYVVRCLECSALYTAGDDTETAEVEGSWSRTMPAEGRSQVSLTVSAGERETHLEGEIWVDGRRIARDRVDSTSGGTRTLRLTATVSRAIARLDDPLDGERIQVHDRSRKRKP